MDSSKVQVKRTKHGEETVTGISYLDSKDPSRYSHLALDESKDQFELTADQAAAAVATGGFAVTGSSKSKTKDEGSPLDE